MVFFDETSYLIIEVCVEKYLPSKIVPTSLFVRPNYQPVGLDLVDVKKIHKTFATLFENINYPFAGLDLVGVDDTDGHALERSDSTGTTLNRFLVKTYN